MTNQPLRVPYAKHARWSVAGHLSLGLVELGRAVGQRSQRLNSRPHPLREEDSFKGQRALWFMALSHARKIRYIHSHLVVVNQRLATALQHYK